MNDFWEPVYLLEFARDQLSVATFRTGVKNMRLTISDEHGKEIKAEDINDKMKDTLAKRSKPEKTEIHS
jgi:hypothetical protein